MVDVRRFITRYRPFFLPLLVLGVVLIVFFVGIIPGINTTISVFQQISVLEEEVGRLKKRLAVLQSLDQSTLQRQLELTSTAVPVTKNFPSILQTIETLGADSNVGITGIVIQNPGSLSTESAKIVTQEEKHFGASIIPLTVTLSGSLDAIETFLDTSIKIRRLVRARSFSLSFADDEVSTQMTFDTFYAPLVKKSTPVELVPITEKEARTLSTVQSFVDKSIFPQLSDSVSVVEKINPFAP